MLLAFGIVCIVVGLALWWWFRIGDRAMEQGRSLGLLEGRLRLLGKRIGCNLEDENGLQSFLQMYEEKVSNSQLPESLELRRKVFNHGPSDPPWEEQCEQWRKAGIAMWYVMGMMHQRSSQEEVKELLYNLYEKHKRNAAGLEAELGKRDRNIGARFGIQK